MNQIPASLIKQNHIVIGSCYLSGSALMMDEQKNQTSMIFTRMLLKLMKFQRMKQLLAKHEPFNVPVIAVPV